MGNRMDSLHSCTWSTKSGKRLGMQKENDFSRTTEVSPNSRLNTDSLYLFTEGIYFLLGVGLCGNFIQEKESSCFLVLFVCSWI